MALDWNDLRYFLAVARAGTTLGGATALGVNQTTCARRISALEGALGLSLFERRPGGYALTAAGALLVSEAERVEAAATAFDLRAAEALRASRKLIRLSTNEVLAKAVATPAIAACAGGAPTFASRCSWKAGPQTSWRGRLTSPCALASRRPSSA